VILNGDGADELFGGYRRYVPFANYDFFKSGGLVKNAANVLNKVLPKSHNKKSFYNYLYRLASLASKDSVEIYLSAGVDIFEDYEHLIQAPEGLDYISVMRKDFDALANSSLSGLKKIMNMDFDATLFTDLLVKMDIATMAHSLEGRSPFLCKEILEYAPGLDDKYKIHGSSTKYLLRQLAKKYLPSPIIHQPKRGFEIPLKNWVNGELKEIIHDYVGGSNALSRQLLQPGAVEKLLADHGSIPAEKRAKILWTLFSLECWYKRIYLQ
jgi:asparagine synthase (glutamine-hydrolysing)